MHLEIPESLDLAKLHLSHGRLADAKSVCEGILKVQPQNADALHQLALVELSANRFEAAAEILESALLADPTRSSVYADLCDAYEKLVKFDKQLAVADRLLSIEPTNLPGQIARGRALVGLDNLVEAITVFQQVVRQEPGLTLGHFNLGWALQKRGHLEDAIVSYGQALRIDSQQADARTNLALIYLEQGKTARAASLFRQEIRTNPENGRAYFGLALARRFTPGDPRIRTLVELSASQRLSGDARSYIQYALGKAYDDIGEYDKAFETLRQANEERRELLPYDPSLWVERVDEIVTADQASDVWLGAETGTTGFIPVFVIGLSRSGKSLVESLLVNSPKVLAGRERGFFRQAIMQVVNTSPLPSPASRYGYPYCLPDLRAEHLENINRLYFETFRQFIRGGEEYIVNTSPRNIEYVGMTLRCLPNAKIVLCQRNDLDQALYLYFKRFEDWHSYSHRLEDIAHWLRHTRRLVDYWMDTYGDQILEIGYEDLVANPRKKLREITDFVGIDPLPAKVTKGVHDREVGHWRHYERYLGEFRSQMPEAGDRGSEARKQVSGIR